jgi:hypothetical protein
MDLTRKARALASSRNWKISLIGVRKADIASSAARSVGARFCWMLCGMMTASITVAVIAPSIATKSSPFAHGLKDLPPLIAVTILPRNVAVSAAISASVLPCAIIASRFRRLAHRPARWTKKYGV